MREVAEYLRKKFADVSLSISEEVTATLEPFMSERKSHEPLVLNLNSRSVHEGEGEDNGES